MKRIIALTLLNIMERARKGTVATLCIVMLAGYFSSCSKTGVNILVEYKPCPCEEGKSMQAKQDYDLREEAYVFMDSLPKQLPSMYDGDYATYKDAFGNYIFPKKYCIVYDSKTNVVSMYQWGLMHIALIRICNFPDMADEIPENGCKVYFKGTMYEDCDHTPHGSEGVYFDFNFMLTHLEIR